MGRRRSALADWLAAAAIGALVFAWLGHAFLNYDTLYAVVWGSDLAHGRVPDYGVPVAPTPHPLATAIGIVLTPFGAAAEDLMLALGLLALGMLVVGLFRLGQELFGAWVGLAAALIIVTRVPVLSYGIRGYVDLATVAFVVWAAVLEARRPRRGAAVLVLLALAGLLRPEAWLYAAAYWLWLLTGERRAAGPDARTAGPDAGAARAAALRPGIVLLAAAGPLVWLASDLLITGNPLHSLSGTHDLAAELGRRTGLTALPEVAPRRLGEILRLPELIAAVGGLGFGLAWTRRRTALPLAIAALNGVAFTAFAIARLPLLGRYLFVAAAMLAILAGLGALGWTALPREHPARRAWAAFGAAALLAVAILFPLQQVDRLDLMKDDIAARDRIQSDLRTLIERPGVERAIDSCARIYVPTHRPVPLVALYAGIDPARVAVPEHTATGCAIVPATARVAELAVLDPNEPGTAVQPRIGVAPESNRSWVFSRRATLRGAE